MVYRYAILKDLDLLVRLRLDFLHVDKNHESYLVLRQSLYDYFADSFQKKEQEIVLVEEEGRVIGSGIIFYYTSVPSLFNLTGKNGYITSMYVSQEYRGQGIATRILEKLIENARERNISCVLLSASEMGRPLYYKKGFVDSKDGMYLTLK